MVLENYRFDAPRQLSTYEDNTRRLSYILLMPLFDGVFATMLVSGYLDSVPGMLNAAFTIFAGAGALTVVLTESETVENARNMVVKSAPLLIAGSLLTALVAPAFESMLFLNRIRVVSGLAVAIIALQIAGVRGADRIPLSPLILAGILVSIRPTPEIAFTPSYIIPALATVSAALAGLYLVSGLEGRINVDYMRKGGVVVLLIISASLLGLGIPSETGLAVLAASILTALRY